MTDGTAAWARRAPLVAAAVALLVHLPSLGGGFIYDDVPTVLDNRSIRDLGQLGSVLRYEPSRPLLSLTWAVNYAVAGPTPWPYHLVNILIHAANAALVASLFLWMAARCRPRPSVAALWGACLFAATPMAAETVGYVASRSTALASLLGLASLRLAVSCLEASSPRRLAAALAIFVLALATKEEAVCIPLLLLLLDYFFVAAQRASAVARRWPVHAPFLALPILGLLGRRAATGAWLPPAALDPARYAATQVAAFSGYFLRALFPIDPAFYRGQPAAPWPPDAATLLGWAATLTLIAAAVYGRRRWPDWSLAVAWLAAGLLPSSSIVPLKEMVVDHRAYLGSAGVQFAVGGLLARSVNAWPAVSLVALLGLRAVQYERVLADPVQAWQDAVRRAPRAPEARLALGEAYAVSGDPRAEQEFRHAVVLDRHSAMAWTNLGAFFVETGRLPEAAWAMRRAADEAPADARIRDNLGLILERLGREDEAMAEYEAAAAGWPPLVQPRIRLADLLIRRGQRQRAAAVLNEAVALELDEEDARAIETLRARLR